MPLYWITLAAYVAFAARRMLLYLHIFQQDEYDVSRFAPWLWNDSAYDRRVTVVLLLCGLAQAFGLISRPVSVAVTVTVFAATCVYESFAKTRSKKALVMTSRAKRIYALGLGLAVGVGALFFLPRVPVLAWIVPVQLVPFGLMASTLLLAPSERRIQRRFWMEAHEKVLALRPTVVGITGSYGKTSVKHILGHVLETQAPTLITPGSVNTPMGVSRIVRERLDARHKFFVCEMGAYGPGSIQRLCDLVPPGLGVLTAIGLAHHERFKTLDTVVETKFELAESALANGGSVVLHEQVLGFAYSTMRRAEQPEKYLVVGPSEQCGVQIAATRQGEAGVEADVVWRGKSYTLRAPLYGEHHASNIAIVFGAACALGISPEDTMTALASTPQISHRLEVKRESTGQVVIDDAYNSNPVGFANALRLLSLLGSGQRRRLLVTPGMVELGDVHDAEHAQIGMLAGAHVDVLLAVLPERIPTMISAYADANPTGTVVRCASFAEARAWMGANSRPDDVILIENDLPDLYETRLSL